MAAALKRLVPLADRVLVQRVAAEVKTKGGIILPESNKKMNNATVVAVGPGTVSETGEVVPCGIKPGDQVLLPEFGGTKVEIDSGVDMYLFREADLLGKWENWKVIAIERQRRQLQRIQQQQQQQQQHQR